MVPLFAVAFQLGDSTLPVFKNLTINGTNDRPRLIFSNGDESD